MRRSDNLEAEAYKEKFASHSNRRQKPKYIQTAKSDAKLARGRQAEPNTCSFKERKTALNLVQMAQPGAELNPDKVENLIDTLTVSNEHHPALKP